MNKLDLLLAWEITPASGSNSVQALREEITDWLNRLPDNKECEHQMCVRCGALKPKEESAKRPEWEVEFDKLLQYDPSEPAEERLKEFIREEMKKLGEQIKKNYTPPYILGFLHSCKLETEAFHEVVNEALKERGVEK